MSRRDQFGRRVERFMRQVEEEWQNTQVALAYRKWDRDESEWGRTARELIIERAKLPAGLCILDVGSGHGEPAPAIAENVGGGPVTLTGSLSAADERRPSGGLSR
jgi:cyclopropane fatty-acyl-phospholipid synthase-like methyltransferase